jgi:large subunit ribosomal protein L15
VNLGAIQKLIDAGTLDASVTLDHAALKAAGLARGGRDGVRLLGKGTLTSKVNFTVAGASKGAIEAVEKAGGKVDVIEVITAAEKAAAKKGKIRLKRIEAKNEKIAANKG